MDMLNDIITWLVAIVLCIFVLTIFFGNTIKENICYDKCYNPNVTCDHNDNNCENGAHYCGDMCYGGTTSKSLIPYGTIFSFMIAALVIVVAFKIFFNRRPKDE